MTPEIERKDNIPFSEYSEETHKIRMIESAIQKTKRIAKIQLASVALASAVGVVCIFTFNVTLLALAGVAAIAALVGLIILNSRSKSLFAAESALTSLFQAIGERGDGLSTEKLQFFADHGQYCRSLRFKEGEIAPGVELGSLFEQLSNGVVEERLRGLLQISDASQSLISTWQPCIMELTDQILQYNLEANEEQKNELFTLISSTVPVVARFALSSENKPLYSTNRMIPIERITRLIASCPHLKHLDLGNCAHESILKACLKLPIKHFSISKDCGIRSLPSTLETFTIRGLLTPQTLTTLHSSSFLKKVYLNIPEDSEELYQEFLRHFSKDTISTHPEGLASYTRRKRTIPFRTRTQSVQILGSLNSPNSIELVN